jgi:hypothetical protein
MNPTIKVYENEATAGLAEKITANNVVAYCVEAKPNNEKNISFNSEEGQALAQNDNQKDLYYIDSILVSTGWNLNDDVFNNAQVWAARNTPEDKQFNLEHDEKRIVGHITKNSSLLFDGETIEGSENPDFEMPEDFEILISTVLYTKWRDPEYTDLIQTTIAEIENGEWSVSMECHFSDFDYAVETTEGEQTITKVIERDEESSFLTQHLRSYGGSGEFEGYKIGRMLKSITFSGVGLVRNPANKRSVIKSSNFQTASVNDIFSQEKDMSEDVLKAELELAKSEAKAESDALNLKLSEANSTIEAKELVITELKEAISAKEQELTEANEKIAAAEATIAETQKEMVTASRRSQLAALSLESEEVEQLLAKFDSVDDDTFAEILAIKEEAIKAKKDNPFKNDDDKDDDEDKDDSKADVKADVDEAVAEEDDDLGVDVQSSEDVAMATIANASAFFARKLNKTEEKEQK